MLTALNLGDMVFDPRGYIYVKSLRAVAAVGLMECEDAAGASVLARDVVDHYEAESFIAIGPVSDPSSIAVLKAVLPEHVRIHVVNDKSSPDVLACADREHVEMHQELVWAKYRFSQNIDPTALELYFVSAIGGSVVSHKKSVAHVIKFGSKGLSGRSLPVFLKGFAQVMLPSVNPRAKKVSALRKDLARYDAFAAGHTRVFPMGRISEIEPAATFGKVPLAVSTMKKKKGKSHGKTVEPASS